LAPGDELRFEPVAQSRFNAFDQATFLSGAKDGDVEGNSGG